MSQVSVNEVSCVRLELLPPKGHPAFPFIDQGKGLGYTRETERKRNRRKRKTERKRALGLRRLSSPAGPTDDDGCSSTL
jgi:hypothetical protein